MMKAGEALVQLMKSKSYWHGVVQAALYPIGDRLVASTDNKLDDAGLQMGKQFLAMVLAEDEDAKE
jgi:hypothetical protein